MTKGSRTTAGWTADNVPNQAGKTVVVTGASSGIGLETARVLAGREASVVLAVRNPAKGEAALADIRSTHPDAELQTAPLDLADLSSVRAFAAWLDSTDTPVHTLINNAGISAVPRQLTVDGFESQFGTNHLGHFALTGLLIERLLDNEDPRVVTVASLAHRSAKIDFEDLQSKDDYGRLSTYGKSKLANLYFTMELHRRFRRAGREDAMSVAAHPGVAITNLVTHVNKGLWGLANKVVTKTAPAYAQPVDAAAWPLLRAATDPRVKGGDYFGPAGRTETRGPAVKVKPKRKVYDVHEARGLWEASVELTGVSYDELAQNAPE